MSILTKKFGFSSFPQSQTKFFKMQIEMFLKDHLMYKCAEIKDLKTNLMNCLQKVTNKYHSFKAAQFEDNYYNLIAISISLV